MQPLTSSVKCNILTNARFFPVRRNKDFKLRLLRCNSLNNLEDLVNIPYYKFRITRFTHHQGESNSGVSILLEYLREEYVLFKIAEADLEYTEIWSTNESLKFGFNLLLKGWRKWIILVVFLYIFKIPFLFSAFNKNIKGV